jgi:hypothetical protein
LCLAGLAKRRQILKPFRPHSDRVIFQPRIDPVVQIRFVGMN